MKQRILSLCTLLFLGTALAAGQSAAGKRTVSNDLYTVAIPATWKPANPELSDGITPYERSYYKDKEKKVKMHLSLISWYSPDRDKMFTDGYSLHIKSFRRSDGQPVTEADLVNEIEQGNRPPVPVEDVKWKELKAKPGQRRILITRKGQAISAVTGSFMQQERTYYLLQTAGKTAHLMSIYLAEDYYRKHPEAEQVITEIMDSFKIN